ncbi:MAG TPA: hypothetical protein VMA36_07505 [Candidatus Limnocylindria bacterium]|jgi:hypothetical protein|nr:hypothetical protein [Candidatus Limnocylindria bacterium]
MPSFLIATTFLGQPCGSGSTHGVNPELRIRLQAADEAVRAAFDALAPERRIDAATGIGNASFSQWIAVSGPHLCWQANAPHHSAGAAIDIDAADNPYIVTRNGSVPGGEPGGERLVDMRNRALASYDRAMQFRSPSVPAADVSRRRPNESTPAAWARFKAVSDALARYLCFVVDPQPKDVSRVALENADDIPDDALLATIPEPERLPLDPALERLAGVLGSPEFQASHPRWERDPRAQYLRMLRDYEHARIPLVIGPPSAAPLRTRNPARGFLQLRREIVTALCDQGLRWGACDFGIDADGSSQNGAMMHFDLADDGGYPEINSLLRFG